MQPTEHSPAVLASADGDTGRRHPTPGSFAVADIRRACRSSPSAYHRDMARLIFLLIGLALVGLGIYWRWFEPTAAEKPVVTRLEIAVRMVRDGEGRVPVRIDAPPAFVQVHRTQLIRPGYAPCRVGEAGDDASTGTVLGCRRRIDAALEAGGWRIEQTASDNFG